MSEYAGIEKVAHQTLGEVMMAQCQTVKRTFDVISQDMYSAPEEQVQETPEDEKLEAEIVKFVTEQLRLDVTHTTKPEEIVDATPLPVSLIGASQDWFKKLLKLKIGYTVREKYWEIQEDEINTVIAGRRIAVRSLDEDDPWSATVLASMFEVPNAELYVTQTEEGYIPTGVISMLDEACRPLVSLTFLPNSEEQ